MGTSPSAASRTGSYSFVPADERERLIVVFADLVVERGIDRVTLEDVAERAGVAAEVVRSHFSSEEDCALAVADVGLAHTFGAAGEAFMSTPGDCPLAARAALDAMLRAMAAIPNMMHFAVVEYGRMGPHAEALRRRGMKQFTEFLVPGFAAAGELPLDSDVLSMLIAGGIFEVVCRYYLEGRFERLPEALPAVTFFTVAPFFGLDEARRVAPVGSAPAD